jgi:hypothetical protein
MNFEKRGYKGAGYVHRVGLVCLLALAIGAGINYVLGLSGRDLFDIHPAFKWAAIALGVTFGVCKLYEYAILYLIWRKLDQRNKLKAAGKPLPDDPAFELVNERMERVLPLRVRITFETDRFNLSDVQEHFINPCCFGEDLATWLKGQLEKHSYAVDVPGQEDWGWYLDVESEESRYLLAINGNSNEKEENVNMGEWMVFVQKRRSLMETLTKKGKITDDDPLVLCIKSILSAQDGIANVGQDTVGA